MDQAWPGLHASKWLNRPTPRPSLFLPRFLCQHSLPSVGGLKTEIASFGYCGVVEIIQILVVDRPGFELWFCSLPVCVVGQVT